MQRLLTLSLIGGSLLLGGALALLPKAEVAAATAGSATGTITGTVGYDGPAPEPVVLQMAADPFCVTAHSGEPVMSDRLVVNDNATLQWAFVRIRDAAAGTLPAGDGAAVTLDQVGCMYTPRIVGMQAGATLRVVNSDRTLHNVNAQPVNNEPFNVAQPIPGMATERVFDNPEIMIPVRCDVHPWMQAFVGVVAHGFFDVSGEDGSFTLDGVPPGDYVLEAWHESLGTRTTNVTVRDGETVSAAFSFAGDR